MTKTALYRHYDAEGALLYVGISDCLSARDKQHAATSHWHQHVVRTETQWCNSRQHALALEAVAVRYEQPRHNVHLMSQSEVKPEDADLLTKIDDFCAQVGMTRSAFGKEAMGDSRFVFDLAAGRDCRRTTTAKVHRFMEGASQ